jgi:dihydrofolate synthase/folylpolyglutamate synthase
VSITERIEIDGSVVTDEVFAQAVLRVHECAREARLVLTEFELITAAALSIFAQSEVEYAVLEVGLGGRWDATSVVHPVLAVLTGVDLDHTAILGNTIAEIAAEKAAIIKQDTIVVAAPTDAQALEVFKKRSEEQGSRFVMVPTAINQEPGSYQAQNKLTALTAARELGLPSLQPGFLEKEAYEVMGRTVIPGRLEVLHRDPLLIIDAAHNPASAQTLVQSFNIPHALLLLAVLSDKDARGIVTILAPHFDEIVVTQTASPRAIAAEELAKLVEEITGRAPRVFQTPQAALKVLLKQEHPLVATGSITLAGEVKRLMTCSKTQISATNEE